MQLGTSAASRSDINSVQELLPTYELLMLDDAFNSKPKLTLKADTVFVVIGNKFMSKDKYASIRNWFYRKLEDHLNAGGKVLLLCDGDRDQLNRTSKWKEFSTVDGEQSVYSNFTECVGLLQHIRQQIYPTSIQPKVKYVHWELGDHADDAIQAESAIRKKSVKIQDHYDDCGDDIKFIELPNESQCMFVLDFDEAYASDSGSEAEIFDGTFLCHFLNGNPQASTSHKDFCTLLSYLQSISKGIESDDFIEVFGGDGGCTRLGLRRKLRCGKNFDLSCNIDLSQRSEEEALWRYIKAFKPMVIIMSPPCTAFGAWSAYNKVHAHEAWYESYRLGRPLAKLSAQIAQWQLDHGLHFVTENPWTSKLWQLPEWLQLLKDPRIRWAYTDQCMFELRDADGNLSMKPTCFVCSCEELAQPLKRHCDKSHVHSQLAGTLHGISKTKYAQTWPVKLCAAIIKGIVDLKRRRYQYPANPVVEVCKACRMHARRDDIRHTRDETCKFPHDIGVNWECPQCKKHSHGHHPKHTRVPGECQWAEAQRRITSSRITHPKDPRVPSAAVPVEATAETEQSEPPPATSVGNWTAVSNLALISLLEQIRQTDGWHRTDYGPACVSADAHFLRTPEPRLEQDQYPRRSVFGWFPESSNPYGNWWQVQDNALSKFPGNLGYSVPVLVHIFHKLEPDSSPAKIKPGKVLSSSETVHSDDEPSEATPSNPSQIKPFVPAQPRDAGEAEVTPDALAIRDEEDDKVAINPDWTSFDLGKSLRALRSTNIPVVVRQLRVLHLRWWHAKAAKMRALLQSAGLPKTVLDQVQGVVDSCRVCRLWQSNGRNAVTSNRQSIEFNETIQIDLLFISELIILHMVCEATRWSAATIVPSKKCEDLIPAIIQNWFRIYGPPTTIVADHEGALCGEEAAIAFERWNVAFKPKPIGSHAYTVERHNALLRSQFNHIKAQCILDKLDIPDAEILSEAVFAKNTLLQVNGRSPYQAVIGRTPKVLQEFEKQGVSAIADSEGGNLSRHAVRLRELALQSMIEGTAADRLRRAATTNTRAAGELQNLQVGDSIDIWRTPATKDSVGWRGPATVIGTSNIESGYIDAKWQGRAMSVRVADARRSIVYIAMLDSTLPQLKLLTDFALGMHECEMTFAVVQGPKGWTLSRSARENKQIFKAGLYVGANVFNIRCVGIRLGTGIASLRGLFMMNKSVLFWYTRSNPSDYRTMSHDGTMNLNLKTIFGSEWETQNWIQFLGVDDEQIDRVRQALPDEPMLAPPADNNAHILPPRLEPIPEDAIMNDPDEDMEQPIEAPPPPPPWHDPRPPRQQPRSRERTPVPSQQSNISSEATRRQSINTNASIHSATSASTLPEGWVREHRQPGLEPKRRSQPAPKGQSAASSSWETPATTTIPTPAAASTQIPAHVPVLPIHTDPTDQTQQQDSDEDDISTLDPSEVEFYSNNKKHPPSIFSSDDSTLVLYEILRSQEEYLANTTISDSDQSNQADIDDCYEIEFNYFMARLLDDCPPMEPTDNLVFVVNKKTGKTKRMIEKAFDILTTKEIKENWEQVEEAFRKEVKSYKDNQTYEISLRTDVQNSCSSKWVIKWKSTPDGRVIKCRLTIRGFEDMQSDLATYSSTASRWGQRIICSVAVQRQWTTFVADITTAFLQGLTFEDLAKLDNSAVRSVGFIPPAGSEKYFQELEPNYVPWRDVLKLRKPAYGLKDAPKAWRTRLVQVLQSTGGKPLHTDPNLFVWYHAGQLTCIISTHVDDLKGCGIAKQVQDILTVLERAFGKLKLSERVFEHCGIKHEQSTDNKKLRLHQNHYTAQLQLMDLSQVDMKANALLNDTQKAEYLSLLGALSWTNQTRMETSVYICALQRAAKAPKAEHASRLNKVAKWAKRKPAYLTYETLPTPCCILAVSDSAFRKEDLRGLAMRGAVIGIGTASQTSPGGKFHVIEFYSRKQRRVTRSTFSAELNGFSDTLEFARLLALTMTEILNQAPSASQLTAWEEKGMLTLPIHGVIDARSVFDALAADEIRPPSEISLIMMLCGIKEMLRTGVMRRMWWVDTRDMVADGLNKGACSREGLLQLGETGVWKVNHTPVGFTEPVHQPIRSTLESITAEEHD